MNDTGYLLMAFDGVLRSLSKQIKPDAICLCAETNVEANKQTVPASSGTLLVLFYGVFCSLMAS